MAPSDLREHRHGPRAPAPPARRTRGGPRSVAAGSCSLLSAFGSFAFAVPTRNWSLAPGVVLRLGVPSAPGVTPGGGCAGCPGFGFSRTLPRVAAPRPRLPQGPGVPVQGHHRGLSSSESHGSNPGLWDRPVASSLAPGLSGQRFSFAKTPRTPHQRLGQGELGHPLASPTTSFGCRLPSSPVAFPGFGGGGCQYYTAAAFPGGRAGGAPGAASPSQNTRDCLWSVEPHRRVCTLQILQQNIF